MIVSPGFNPVPYKLILAIILGHYVNFAALLTSLSEDSVMLSLLLVGWRAITPPPILKIASEF